MNWHVVGRYQQWRLNQTHTISGDGECETSVVSVDPSEELVNHGHCDFGTFLAERMTPGLDVGLIETIWALRNETAGLHQRSHNHPLRNQLE